MHQNMLNLIGLLNFDADSDAVDAWLNEDFLVVVPRYGQRVQQDLWRACRFNLGDIVSL